MNSIGIKMLGVWPCHKRPRRRTAMSVIFKENFGSCRSETGEQINPLVLKCPILSCRGLCSCDVRHAVSERETQ